MNIAEVRQATGLQWAGMVWNATGEMLDADSHCAIAVERVGVAREQGALGTPPVAPSRLAWNERLVADEVTDESAARRQGFAVTIARCLLASGPRAAPSPSQPLASSRCDRASSPITPAGPR